MRTTLRAGIILWLLPLLVVLVLAPGPATPPARGDAGSIWISATTTPSPPPRQAASMAYDPDREEVVLFGGSTGGNPASGFDDTWLWDANGWRKAHPAHRPPPRSGAAMAYDSGHQVMVLFGGGDGGGDGRYADTWTWDGQDWTEMRPSYGPSARQNAGMADDSANSLMVLFGGRNIEQSIIYHADTWTWDGSSWRDVSRRDGPGPRVDPTAMAYDAGRQQIVLFAAAERTGSSAETWLWDGSAWSRADPETSPPVVTDAAMAYDANLGGVVLFGGCCWRNDAWLWDGTTWSAIAAENPPPGRQIPSLAYDSLDGELVLFGGRNTDDRNQVGRSIIYGDTWVLPDPGEMGTPAGEGPMTPSLPPAPTNFTVTAPDASHLRFDWSQPGGDPDGFLIVGAGTGGNIELVPGTARTATGIVTSSGHYCAWVDAYNAGGYSLTSSTACADTPP